MLSAFPVFNSSAEAIEFKKFYESKSLAETDDHEGEFCIIKVNKGNEANQHIEVGR